MPELPEVETIVNDLKNAGIEGWRIRNVYVFWPRSIAKMNVDEFCRLLTGQKIVTIERRGKYLIFALSKGYDLCLHLRMTGHLLLSPPKNDHLRLQIDFDNGKSLYYKDTRKFGKWYLVKNRESIIGKLGLEPLSPEFTFQRFFDALKKRGRFLKPLLLDQTFVAGLGNIYVDEALWESKIHPLQPANSLTRKEAMSLHQNIIYVLQRGIASQGTALGDGQSNYYRLDGTQGGHQLLLNVFRRKGQHCPRCQHLIERIIVGQRSTHFCPHCQKLKVS